VTDKVVRRFERTTELEPIGRRLACVACRLAAGDSSSPTA
jgi:hypothetical protein